MTSTCRGPRSCASTRDRPGSRGHDPPRARHPYCGRGTHARSERNVDSGSKDDDHRMLTDAALARPVPGARVLRDGRTTCRQDLGITWASVRLFCRTYETPDGYAGCPPGHESAVLIANEIDAEMWMRTRLPAAFPMLAMKCVEVVTGDAGRCLRRALRPVHRRRRGTSRAPQCAGSPPPR